MTFASVSDMKVIIEFIFDGFVIIGAFALALAAVGVALTITTALLQYANRKSIQVCTRPAPHVCKVNGPCNGWPRV